MRDVFNILGFIYLVWVVLFLRKSGDSALSQGNYVFPISFLVVFRNEEKRILPLLESFLKLERNKVEFEVIFVDDHSNDNTCAVIHSIFKEYSIKYKIIESLGNGKKSGIETGCSYVAYEWIFLTDADVNFSPDVLISKEKWIGNADMIIGLMNYPRPKKWLEYYMYYENMYLMGLSIFTDHSHQLTMCNGAHLMFKKDAFLEVNPYMDNRHIPTGDDVFLLHAFKETGKWIVVDDESNVETVYAESWSHFKKQRIRWSSKNLFLRDKTSSLLGVFMLVINLGWILSFFSVSWFLILFKPVAELIWVKKSSQKLGQPLHLFYATFSVLLAPFMMFYLLLPSIFKGLSYKRNSLAEENFM